MNEVKHAESLLTQREGVIGFSRFDRKNVGLQFVYPQRKFQSLQMSAFSEFFIGVLNKG